MGSTYAQKQLREPILHYEQLAEQFWQKGYLHLKHFYTKQQLTPLDTLIRDHYGLTPEYWHNEEFLETSATDVIPWFPVNDGITDFNIIEEDERLKKISQAILGDDWYSLYCMCMYSKPYSKGQAWHQDCPPENKHAFNLNRLIYSSKIDKDNGGQLVLVPETHRGGRIPVGPVDENLTDQLVIQPEVGDVIFLHGHCWHRVLPLKDKSRLSTNFRCAPSGTPTNVTDISVYRNMVYRFSTSEIIEQRTDS